MHALLAACCLVSSLAAFAALRARERRIVAGRARIDDLAAWTGITDRRGLLRIAGVRERPDGTLALDPRFLDSLPANPLHRALDNYVGNGLSVAVCLAALGVATGAGGAAADVLAHLVLCAAGYQLLARLWSAAVWLELRVQD